MNREIKFRAWDNIHNKMIYTDKDSGFRCYKNECFDYYAFEITKQGLHCVGYDDYDDDYDDDYGGGICNETELNIMQYTGLKDAGQVDIYEGDILELNDDILIVEWDECGFVYRDDNVIVHQLEDIADISNVIGNIFETKLNNNE